MSASSRLGRVVIDLTPVLPGGDNGGARIVARELVREFGTLAPETDFVLLTSALGHADLADLDAPNVHRQCVDADPSTPVTVGAAGSLARRTLRVLLDATLPPAARGRVKDSIWRLVKRHAREQISRESRPDVHFAPFTAPFFHDSRVPLVAVVHDLQFLAQPENFTPAQRHDRERHFRDACDRADRLICVSDFVRQTVLEASGRDPRTVQTIHSAVLHATAPQPGAAALVRELRQQLGVPHTRYLLYPANTWPHKNHARLIEGFAEYVARTGDADLALICTGAFTTTPADELTRLARRLLPPGRVAFAGYLPERTFSAVLQECRALIFPSLYEGFGLPVLEAMACARPVLCSNAASLPEIAGAAALLFDGRDVSAIADAIERLETEPMLAEQLVQAGRERVAAFGSARQMAERYLAALADVMAQRRASGPAATR